jgi:hypothetical protein
VGHNSGNMKTRISYWRLGGKYAKLSLLILSHWTEETVHEDTLIFVFNPFNKIPQQ